MRALLLLGLLLWATSVTATPAPQTPTTAAPETLKMGFVNLRKVMAYSPQIENIRRLLQNEFRGQRQSLETSSRELQKLEQQLAAQTPGTAAYDAIEKQLLAKRRDFARLDASYRDAYSVRRNEELAKFQQLVIDEIIHLSKEKGYDIVLNDTGVIYVSSRADLTGEVIQRLTALNQEH